MTTTVTLHKDDNVAVLTARAKAGDCPIEGGAPLVGSVEVDHLDVDTARFFLGRCHHQSTVELSGVHVATFKSPSSVCSSATRL